ncbi:MAG: flagellar basal body rod protein FlgC [Bacillota bacterium]|nr:MAG: flagellar basal body rod protein FlgC [Bacillota bacterium]
MRLFQAMEASASALTAERLRMDIIANNLANYRTTRTPEGGPYRRRYVVVEERPGTFASALARETERGAQPGLGVRVARIAEDPSPFKEVYDPTHPDADPVTGIVRLPNVDLLQELTDLILAQRMYDANLTAFNAAKSMAMRALEIGR